MKVYMVLKADDRNEWKEDNVEYNVRCYGIYTDPDLADAVATEHDADIDVYETNRLENRLLGAYLDYSGE